MDLKFLLAVAIFATVPIGVLAQQDMWKPTIDDAQKLVDAISGDKDKLETYCEINRTHEQLDRAEEKGDAKEFDVGVAKLDSLEPQMGPDYLRMMDGLGDVDPNSAEGQKFTAVFAPLHKQCRTVNLTDGLTPADHMHRLSQLSYPRRSNACAEIREASRSPV